MKNSVNKDIKNLSRLIVLVLMTVLKKTIYISLS